MPEAFLADGRNRIWDSEIRDAPLEKTSIFKIGYEVKVDRQGWSGPVFATPDAIYCFLIINSNGRFQVAVGGVLGGAIGGAIAGMVIGPGRTNSPSVGLVQNLPAHLLDPANGPFRRYKQGTRVLTIPRSNVTEIVKASAINNTLRLHLEGQRIVITHSLFKPSPVRDYLAATGWPLRWRKQVFNMEG